MNYQMVEGLKRGGIEGLIAAGGAFFAALQVVGSTYEQAGIAAGAAFFAAMALRWGESMFDARRAARVASGREAPIAGDVGSASVGTYGRHG